MRHKIFLWTAICWILIARDNVICDIIGGWDQVVFVDLLDDEDLAGELRDDNAYLPDECRTDLCPDVTTVDFRKGTFYWPQATVGTRVYYLCPYALEYVIYAHWDCVAVTSSLSNKTIAEWETHPTIFQCPDPLFSEILQRLHEELQEPFHNLYDASILSQQLLKLHDAIRKFPEDPLFIDDVAYWEEYFGHMLQTYSLMAGVLPLEDTTACVEITAFLMTKPDNWKIFMYNSEGVRVNITNWLSQLGVLTNAHDVIYNVTLGNSDVSLSLYRVTLVGEGDSRVVRVENKAIREANSSLGVMLSLDDTPDASEKWEFLVSSLVISPKVLDENFRHVVNRTFVFFQPPTPPATFVPLPPPVTLPWEVFTMPPLTLEMATETAPLPDLIPITTASSRPPLLTARGTAVTEPTRPPPSMPRKKREVMMTTSDLTRDLKQTGPILHVDVKAVNRSSLYDIPRISMRFLMELIPSPGDEIVNPEQTLMCAHTPFEKNIEYRYRLVQPQEELTQWFTNDCEQTVVNLTVRCLCKVLGFQSLFALLEDRYYPVVIDTTLGPAPTIPDLSLLLGFEYIRELFITSHVLRALSLACLVATLVSYALFRRTRRGSSTLILLNLCVALVALLVVLYVGEAVAHDYIGCRVANILRYYLVLVSLMWNGVEAVNMYLKLVKVFKSDVHRFVLKASFVAWGVPGALIGIGLAVDLETFDGIYEDCAFKCTFRDNTLYYAYILPMCLIILHNLIVFAMVLRVLIKHHQTHREGRRARWMQLIGAVTLLVLLGIPWIFSAFGAIDVTNSDELKIVEGVFQVIFVVFVNLQGVFIFVFHCARNAEVRQQWTTLIRSGLSTTSDASQEMRSKNTRNTPNTTPEARRKHQITTTDGSTHDSSGTQL